MHMHTHASTSSYTHRELSPTTYHICMHIYIYSHPPPDKDIDIDIEIRKMYLISKGDIVVIDRFKTGLDSRTPEGPPCPIIVELSVGVVCIAVVVVLRTGSSNDRQKKYLDDASFYQEIRMLLKIYTRLVVELQLFQF